jgi:hypothetical protein
MQAGWPAYQKKDTDPSPLTTPYPLLGGKSRHIRKSSSQIYIYIYILKPPLHCAFDEEHKKGENLFIN